MLLFLKHIISHILCCFYHPFFSAILETFCLGKKSPIHGRINSSKTSLCLLYSVFPHTILNSYLRTCNFLFLFFLLLFLFLSSLFSLCLLYIREFFFTLLSVHFVQLNKSFKLSSFPYFVNFTFLSFA